MKLSSDTAFETPRNWKHGVSYITQTCFPDIIQ